MARGVQGGSSTGPATIATGDTIVGGNYDGMKAQVPVIAYGPDTSPTVVTTGTPLPVVQTGTPGLPTGAATETTLDARTGALTEAAPASDTASSGINGRLQRIAQRLTSLIALLPTSLGQKTKANSLAVTLASDQDVINVNLSTALASGVDSVTAVGDIAAGAGDSGNPVKVGGKYNSSPPTLTNGQRGNLQLDAQGSVRVVLMGADGANAAIVYSTNDGLANASAGVFTRDFNYRFNGPSDTTGTWDFERGNVDYSVFTSSARTATPTPFDGTNWNGRGLHLVIDCTVKGGAAPSVVFTLQGKDVISGKFYTILASAAIVAVGTTILRVYPGLTVAANTVASDIVPRIWRVIATHGNSDSITYSVGASVIQ